MTPERFDTLALALFDDVLTEEQEQELAAYLQASPQARARLRQLARIEGGTAHVARARIPSGIRPVVDRQRRRRRPRALGRHWVVPLAIAATVAAVVAVLVLLPGRAPMPTASAPSSAPAIAIEGPVVRIEGGSGSGTDATGSTIALAPGMLLPAGATVHASAPLVLAWRDERTRLQLDAGTTLRLVSLTPPQRLDLDHGRCDAEVAAQPHDRPLAIHCGPAVATVVGTRFQLTRAGDTTTLSVLSGTVRLATANGSVAVGAGAHASTQAGSSPTLVPPAPTGGEVQVATVEDLAWEVAHAVSNQTITIAPGSYRLREPLQPPAGTRHLTIRGGAPAPEGVRLDARDTRFAVELVGVPDMTLSDLTLSGSQDHLLFIHGEQPCDHLLLQRLRFEHPLAMAIHLVGTPAHLADDGVIEDCNFRMDAADHQIALWFAYINLHAVSRWTIRGCTFDPMAFHDPSAVPQTASAILVDGPGAQNRIIRCRIRGCWRGISWGVGGGALEQQGGAILDTCIVRSAQQRGDAGIAIASSAGVLVAHDTVLLGGTYPHPIELRFPQTTDVHLVDCLTDGPVGQRDGASASLEAVRVDAQRGWFTDPDAADGHLALPPPAQLLTGVSVPTCTVDIDGRIFPATGIALGASQP